MVLSTFSPGAPTSISGPALEKLERVFDALSEAAAIADGNAAGKSTGPPLSLPAAATRKVPRTAA